MNFQEFLNEMVKSVSKAPNDKLNYGIMAFGDIEKSREFEFLRGPDKRQVRIRGDRGRLNFHVHSSWNSIQDVEITKVEKLNEFDPGMEYYLIKGDRGYFDITDPNGNPFWRFYFSDMQRKF